MKLNSKFLLSILLLLLSTVFGSGCINVIHKVKLNEDGSGTMSIRYWTKSSNINGDGVASGFGFTEENVKTNYTCSNSEPTEIRIEKDVTNDSLAMVTLNLKFKDFNELSNAIAFNEIEASFYGDGKQKNFKCVILHDTNSVKYLGYIELMLYLEFEFPGEVISTNGYPITSVHNICWKNTFADLNENIEMIAIINCK